MSTQAPSVPRNDDAERAVLGAVILNNDNLAVAADHVTPEAFFSVRHRMIFVAIERLCTSGAVVDLVTLKTELERTGDLDAAGGPAYLAALHDGVARSTNVEHYSRLVVESHRKRVLQARLAKAYTAAGNGASSEEVLRLIREAEAAGVVRSELRAEDAATILRRPAPSVPWAIPGLLAEGDVGLISGPGGIGKTWLVGHAALCLAVGRPLFARFEVARPYRVAFLDLESTPDEFDLRLHRQAGGLGIKPEDIADRLHVFRQRIRLDGGRHRDHLLRYVERHGIEFLFVDSMRRAFSGDENASGAISDLFQGALDRIRSEAGCGTILTDHVRKQTGDRNLDDPAEALRGSTDKRNMADLHVGVERREERLAWIPTKVRHARCPEPILLEIAGLDGEDDGPVTIQYVGDLDRASDKVQDAIVALLSDAGTDGVQRGEIIGRSGYGESSVEKGLRALKQRGKIRSKKDGKKAVYSLSSVTSVHVRTHGEEA